MKNTTNNRELCIYSDIYANKRVKQSNGKTLNESIYQGKRIDVNEDELDLFKYFEGSIPHWELDYSSIKPFKDVKIFYFDIETYGLDPKKNKITLIGLSNQNGDYRIFNAVENEIVALQSFIKTLEVSQPDIIAGFNNISFDIPFIMSRCDILGVPHPFKFELDKEFKKKIKTRTAATINGKPVSYNPVVIEFKNNHHCAIVDLFHESLAWDFVNRKLTRFGLKYAPVQMKLIHQNEVIDISYEDMLKEYDRWSVGGKDNMVRYLQSDLNLTRLLGQKLIPPVYMQSIFIDWKLQSIFSSGNGSKWNYIIKKGYSQRYNTSIVSDEKCFFKGALSLSKPGIFGLGGKEVCKIDVESLYPSVMELYGIRSHKDKEYKQLSILKALKKERIAKKNIAHIDPDADAMQASMKILINSGYGSLGCKGIEYNDYQAAALVTAYARGIFKFMVAQATKFGGRIATADTDGIIVELPIGKSKELHAYIQNLLPGQDTDSPIKIKLEWVATAVFIPQRDVNNDDDGLKKTYIIINQDENGKIKPIDFKGIYSKRSVSLLDREFQPKLLQAYCGHGIQGANLYYEAIKERLIDKTYPLDKLSITRTIRVGEKNPSILEIGDVGDSITVWKSNDIHALGKKGQALKKVAISGWIDKPDVDIINWQYYIDRLDNQYICLSKYFK